MKQPLDRLVVVSLLVAFLPGTACSGLFSPDTLDPDDTGGEGGELEDEEKERNARMGQSATVSVGGNEVASLNVHPVQIAGDVILHDCFVKLRQDPGAPFMLSGGPRAGCTATEMTSGGTADGVPRWSTATASCEVGMCRAEAALCVAHRLLELSDAVAPTEFDALLDVNKLTAAYAEDPTQSIRGATAATVTVPPPDAESAAALKEAAFHYGAWAAALSGENLRKGAGRPATQGICTATQLSGTLLDGIPYGEAFANMLTEAIAVGGEAARGAADGMVAAAEAAYARVPDRSLASELAWSHGSLSRARAAHLLIGGGFGQGLGDYRAPGNTEVVTAAGAQSFCPSATLLGKEKEALEILRLAAPHPWVVADLANTTFPEMFETNVAVPSGPPDSSLRARLAQRLGDPTLSTTGAITFMAKRKLTEAHFTAARAYMTQEIKAFARDKAAVLPPVLLSTTTSGAPVYTTVPLYTATGSEPAPPPGIHYQTMARFPHPTTDITGQYQEWDAMNVDPSQPAVPNVSQVLSLYPGASLAALTDWGRIVTSEVLYSGQLTTTARTILATYLGAEGGRIEGRLESCYRYTVPAGTTTPRDEMRVRLYGSMTSAGDYLMVVGASGLRCAVTGSVEGAPCTLSSYALGAPGSGSGSVLSPLTLGSLPQSTDPRVTFPSFLELRFVPPLLDPPVTIHVVKRRADVLAPVPPAALGPGQYEVVTSFRPVVNRSFGSGTNNPYPYCSLLPVHDDLALQAQAILTPSAESCGQAALTCAGTSVADKIPLESELSDDGNGIESSWRVYLDRARVAAHHADQLGEQLIESGLEIDRRIEGSVEDLTRLCGADVSLADFFPADMSGYLGGSCAATSEGLPCPVAGQICRSGRCVADPVQILQSRAATDPAAARLVACLGADTLMKVALGTKPMCLWRNKTTSHFCDPIDGKQCPFPAAESGSCVDPGLDANHEIVGPAQPLGLFSAPDPGSEQEPDAPVACSAVRRLRQGGLSNPQRALAISQLNTGFFSPDNVRAYASRIGWRARPLDYSAITLDGSAVFETGTIFRSPHASSKWPCTAGPYPDRENAAAACTAVTGAPEDEASLFCSYTTCDPAADATGRARMNHRMARAVLALRLLSGAGLGPAFRGPFRVTPEYVLHRYLGDVGSAPDLASHGNTWPSSNTTSTVNGHSITSASALGYRVVDGDFGSDDDVKVLDVTGVALCFNNAPLKLWTAIEGAITGSSVPYDASCSASPLWMPMFKSYPSLQGTNPGPLVGQFWMGLDTLTPPAGATGFEALGRRLLNSPGDPDAIVLAANDPRADELTGYWDDERPLTIGIPDLTGGGSIEMNPLQIAQEGLRRRDVLDAMEVMCEVARLDSPGLLESDCSPATAPTSLADVESVERYLRCAGNQIRRRAEREVFIDMPSVVVDALQPGFQLEGELEAAAGEFAAALISFNNQERIVASALAAFAEDLKRLRIQLRTDGIASEMVELNRLSSIANQTAACLSAVADTMAPGVQLGALAVCANSAAQIGITLQSATLEQEGIVLGGELRWIDYQTKFRGYGEMLQEASDQLTADGAAMRAALSRIHTQREKGLRELSRAMMMGTDAAGRHFAVNTVIRRRYNTLAVRYQRALANARQLAWIARRAIEQRLGLRLDDLHNDMLLVESPASWADELCTIGGVDYTRIRAENGLDADDYADQYLGDYVDQLGMVVASYEHDFPFHEGKDTAVISLRDDVSLARRTCEVSANNLLAYSARLDVAYDPDTYAGYSYDANPDGSIPPPPPGAGAAPVWQPVCPAGVSCVSVTMLDGTVMANRPIDASLAGGDVPAYRVQFTGSGPSANYMLAQTVHLTPGYYRFSWYARYGGPVYLMGVVKAVTTDQPLSSPTYSPQAANGWMRHSLTYRITEADDYRVGLRSSPLPFAGYTDVAGFSLEDVTNLHPGDPPVTALPASTLAAGAYVATSLPGVTRAAVCEDTHGEVFHTKWQRGCERLCPAGFGTCDNGPEQCFWELPFDLNLEGIEGGQLLRQAGFAYGNYNYRIGGIAVNIVGTGVKDCTDAPLPTTCQANASVPYSLAHIGPYTVRNHRGESYQAPLFEAHTEHARALAAERYLTNPISPADRSLIDGYEHHELRGRPLTGRYRLRIWDDEGVSFGRIEDVQVVLDYHYWTRFE